jgi:hypothetical protein
MNRRRNPDSLTRHFLPPPSAFPRQNLPLAAKFAGPGGGQHNMVNAPGAVFRRFSPTWKLLPAGREIASQ